MMANVDMSHKQGVVHFYRTAAEHFRTLPFVGVEFPSQADEPKEGTLNNLVVQEMHAWRPASDPLMAVYNWVRDQTTTTSSGKRHGAGKLMPGALSYEIMIAAKDAEVLPQAGDAAALEQALAAAAAAAAASGSVVASRMEDLPAIIASLPKEHRGLRK